MGLADAGRPEQDDVLGALDEAQAGELAHLPAVDGRLELDIELVERLDPRQAGQLEPALDAALVAAAPFGLEGLGEKALVVEVALGPRARRRHRAGRGDAPSSSARGG
jgi:hypothetical protein